MGTCRRGSSYIDWGINVEDGDSDDTAILAEIARELVKLERLQP